MPLSPFSPYDLEKVANIGLYIEEDRRQRLLDLSRQTSQSPPTRGILKPLTEEERADKPAQGQELAK